MKEFKYKIKDAAGLHARPAGLLVKYAKECKSRITIIKEDKQADATRLMAVMGLGVKQGECITVQVTGEEETTEMLRLKTYLEENV